MNDVNKKVSAISILCKLSKQSIDAISMGTTSTIEALKVKQAYPLTTIECMEKPILKIRNELV